MPMNPLRRADGSPVDDATAERWYPDVRPAPEDGVFELGIALAGAVSGGAYAAGVLDFLFEALDAWEAAKQADPAAVPGHRVRLPMLAGASAGGINGAITAVVGTRAFAPARYTAFGASGEGRPPETLDNPFYRTWVRRVDIRSLLTTDDLADAATTPSLLNARPLDAIADELLRDTALPAASAVSRPWLGTHWQLGFTLTNLDGVVFPWDFNNAPQRQQHLMRLHGDVQRFAVPNAAAVPGEAFPPDVAPLPVTATRSIDPQWQRLVQNALGSAAFPLALPSRTLSRPADDYRWRFVDHVDRDWLQATANVTAPYRFTCVDGGVIDNEPFDLVHTQLAGSRGSNPRAGDAANRAVLLLDPFNDDVRPQTIRNGVIPRLLALFTALLYQARFDARNVALASDERIYSRYLVAPSREAPPDGYALTARGLGTFMGFFSEAYRHHDFFLGRANAQRFLRDYLTVPQTNPLIARHWSTAARANPVFRSRGQSRNGECQLIPLVGGLDADQPLPAWPRNAFTAADRAEIDTLVDARLKALLPLLLAELPLSGWLRTGVRILFGGRIRGWAKAKLDTQLDEAMRRVELG